MGKLEKENKPRYQSRTNGIATYVLGVGLSLFTMLLLLQFAALIFPQLKVQVTAISKHGFYPSNYLSELFFLIDKLKQAEVCN